MIQLPAPGGPPVPTWSRAAIHDTVAAIVKQPAYRRDIGTTLLDRIMRWIADSYERLAQSLGGVPHGRIIATIAAVVVMLLIMGRVFYASRLRTVGGATPSVRRGRRSVFTDSWREAEELAKRGRFTEAAHSLYRATLNMLSAQGLVRLHDSKTSGDYARELRRRGSPAYAAFRSFGARYDRVIYGAGLCDAANYSALLEDARTVAGATHARERAA